MLTLSINLIRECGFRSMEWHFSSAMICAAPKFSTLMSIYRQLYCYAWDLSWIGYKEQRIQYAIDTKILPIDFCALITFFFGAAVVTKDNEQILCLDQANCCLYGKWKSIQLYLWATLKKTTNTNNNESRISTIKHQIKSYTHRKKKLLTNREVFD